ncbi:hypothetical protein Q9L58_005724 [Maublancomyces gigas]|uniref:DDRGK domain-containing protein 1 n=1 Tax=Discina gigas TaxID=1032678 RepID=A0ABR3GHD9_9PEZI
MSFLTNLLAFSPLLLLAGLILYLLDRADNLRRAPIAVEPVQPLPLQEGDVAEDDLLAALSDEEYDDGDGDGEDEGDWLPQEEPQDGAEPENPIQPGLPVPIPTLVPAPPPDRTPRTRIIGAKKARSLARRDQRRAYHEFLQSQQSERARQAAVVAEEDEERLFEEKRRRAVAEEEIVARRQSEKAERARVERIRDEEQRRDLEKLRDVVTVRGRGKMAWSLEGLAGMVGREEAWVRAALKSEGLVGGKGSEMRMITEEGWYLVVGEAELKVLYREIEKRGKMEWGEMAKVLEEAIA